MTNTTLRPARARRLIAGALFWLGVVVAVVGLAGLLTPAEAYELESDIHVAIDVDTVQPQEGLAYLVPFTHPEASPSSTGKPSVALLLEDGVPLQQDDVHQNIREKGARYSHWGDHVWFASSDGSDPRTNGRAYELVVPRRAESPLKAWVSRAAWAGAGLMLLGLLSAFRVARLALAAALGATAWFVVDAPRDTLALESEIAATTPRLVVAEPRGGAPPVAGAAARGNVTRLDVGDFTPAGATPREPARPFNLEIVAPDCAEEHEGQLRLSDPACALRGQLTGPGLPARRLAEIVVTGRLLEGSALEVQVISDTGEALGSAFEVPVAPSPDEQTLRIMQPLGVYAGAGDPVVGGVELSSPGSGEAVRWQITGMALIDEFQVFGSAPAGEAAIHVGKSLRPAAWQSVAGEFRVPWPTGAGLLAKGAFAVRHPNLTLPAHVEIAREEADGERRTLQATSTTASAGWQSFRVQFDEGDEPAALILRGLELHEDAVIAWTGLRVVDTSRAPQRVLVTLMDTLRADALGCYGAADADTPRLDALADEGALFENCHSQCYWTRPSMASIMASRYVQATGIHGSAHRLPDAYVTMAEVFAEAGFFTVGTVSNTNAASDAGLQYGWDEFNEHLADDSVSLAHDYCSKLVEPRLLELMDEDLLVYVHLMDAHGPYGPVTPPDDWQPPEGTPIPFDRFLDRPWLTRPTAEARVALYAEDVHQLDEGWGAFVERMLARWEVDDAPPAVVAVMSDHGEFLGEYGQWSHGFYKLVPEVTHVPLIVRAPGRVAPGTRVSAAVENIDVAPTLLELVGLQASGNPDWDGRSLLPALDGDDRFLGQALASAGGRKRLFTFYGREGAVVGKEGAVEHVLRAGQRSPESDERPSLWETLARRRLQGTFTDAWSAYLAHGDAIRNELWSDIDASATVLDPEALEQLQQMGYLAR